LHRARDNAGKVIVDALDAGMVRAMAHSDQG
jgi:hypothetical protein